MSKTDAVRAMREARFAEAQARTGQPADRPKASAQPAAKKATKNAAAAPAPEAEADTDGLCGHRNISGRTCTRERGHAAKSHRYS